MPALLARLGIERYQVVLGDLEVERVAVHGHAAIANVIAAPCRPAVMPKDRAVASIHGPGVVRRRDVEHAVHLEDGAGDARGAAAGARYRHRGLGDPAHNGRCASCCARTSPDFSTTRSSGQRYALPGQRQILDVGAIDLFQDAIPPLRVIARIGGPGIGCRLRQLLRQSGWVQPHARHRACLPLQRRRQKEGQTGQEPHHCFHHGVSPYFNVAR